MAGFEIPGYPPYGPETSCGCGGSCGCGTEAHANIPGTYRLPKGSGSPNLGDPEDSATKYIPIPHSIWRPTPPAPGGGGGAQPFQ